MSRYVFKLPDLGEGIVSSEVVSWRVKPGDLVREDEPLVEMSTDKAVVEVPAPVTGKIVTLGGKPGDVIAVGAELAVLETANGAQAAGAKPQLAVAAVSEAPRKISVAAAEIKSEAAIPTRVKASPSTRRRARLAGIDLSALQGTGPGGRIRREDLDSAVQGNRPQVKAPSLQAEREVREEIPIIGVRRVIAQRMAEAKRTIPHFSYIEEVDMTELEALRVHLNSKQEKDVQALTYLPFIILAMVRAIEEFPQVNARYDAARETIVRSSSVHVGIATQTSDGLKVPVVREAERRSLRDLAAEVARVSEAARTNRARREELTGSTITVTSLGKLGGIATTPVINAPEVAIVGVNRAVERPVVREGRIAVRRMMNLSSSFDHRFVDGYDAAAFVQSIKGHLEHPALLFGGGAYF